MTEVSDRAQAGLVKADRPVVIDVGAHVGMSVRRYLTLFPNATLHSFEPFPESFARLEAATSAIANVNIHMVALADEPGERRFFVADHYTATNSLLQRPFSGRRYYPFGADVEERLTVAVDTLDRFCHHRRISHIDLLKLDVQGGELLVLQGATDLLRRHAVDVIYTEAAFVPHYEGGVLFHELAQFLQAYGYSLFNLFELHVARNGQLRYCDALFISTETRGRVVDAAPPED